MSETGVGQRVRCVGFGVQVSDFHPLPQTAICVILENFQNISGNRVQECGVALRQFRGIAARITFKNSWLVVITFITRTLQLFFRIFSNKETSQDQQTPLLQSREAWLTAAIGHTK